MPIRLEVGPGTTVGGRAVVGASGSNNSREPLSDPDVNRDVRAGSFNLVCPKVRVVSATVAVYTQKKMREEEIDVIR
jgi:hypothetical protein